MGIRLLLEKEVWTMTYAPESEEPHVEKFITESRKWNSAGLSPFMVKRIYEHFTRESIAGEYLGHKRI